MANKAFQISKPTVNLVSTDSEHSDESVCCLNVLKKMATDDMLGQTEIFSTLLSSSASMIAGADHRNAFSCLTRAMSMKLSSIWNSPVNVQVEFSNALLYSTLLFLSTPQQKSTMTMEECLNALNFCLTLRKESLGPDDLGVSEVLYSLALVYVSTEDYSYALDLLLEALSILQGLPAVQQESTVQLRRRVWKALSFAQQAMGHIEDSVSSREEAEKSL